MNDQEKQVQSRGITYKKGSSQQKQKSNQVEKWSEGKNTKEEGGMIKIIWKLYFIYMKI